MSRAAAVAAAARADFARIGQWIEPGARVLDLGCENGAMLEYLRDTRQARGVGVDIAPANIRECLARGLQVVQSDIENGLADFADDSFDAVVLSQTLQSIQRPERVLREMLRAGRVAIVSFPNFGYWRHRLQMLGGRTPRSRGLPFRMAFDAECALLHDFGFRGVLRRTRFSGAGAGFSGGGARHFFAPQFARRCRFVYAR